MFIKIIRKSFARAWKEKLLIILTVAFGASLTAVLLNVALDVGDKVNQELKSYGANIQVVPKMNTLPVEIDGVNLNPIGKQAFLQENDLLKIKQIFWGNNILGFSPALETVVKTKTTGASIPLVGTWFTKKLTLSDGKLLSAGISEIKPWWKITGKWPKETADSTEILVGKQVAQKLKLAVADTLDVETVTNNGPQHVQFTVSGIVDAGGDEDEKIYAPLATVQKMLDLKGRISRAEVSALTVPEDELAKRAGTDPSSLRERDFDKWYCTAFAGAIAYQIEEAIPGANAKPIRQIAQSEGMIVSKIQLLMIIISLAAILCSSLGITSLMNSKVMARTKEIALMKAIGATDWSVASIFTCEALISGFIGGLLGYGFGLVLTLFVGKSVFGVAFTIKWLGLPLILLLSVAITILGSYPAIRTIVKLDPIKSLQRN